MNWTTSLPDPRPPARSREGADQRRPGTAPGHVVNPGPGDSVRGGEERHRIRGGARGLPVGIWPTPWATNASPSPWMTARSSRLPCGSPLSIAARMASGRSSTAMPTFPRPVSPFALMHRRSRHHGQGDQLRSTILVSTHHPRPGNWRDASMTRPPAGASREHDTSELHASAPTRVGQVRNGLEAPGRTRLQGC